MPCKAEFSIRRRSNRKSVKKELEDQGMTVMNCDEQQDVHPEICDRKKMKRYHKVSLLHPKSNAINYKNLETITCEEGSERNSGLQPEKKVPTIKPREKEKKA